MRQSSKKRAWLFSPGSRPRCSDGRQVIDVFPFKSTVKNRLSRYTSVIDRFHGFRWRVNRFLAKRDASLKLRHRGTGTEDRTSLKSKSFDPRRSAARRGASPVPMFSRTFFMSHQALFPSIAGVHSALTHISRNIMNTCSRGTLPVPQSSSPPSPSPHPLSTPLSLGPPLQLAFFVLRGRL